MVHPYSQSLVCDCQAGRNESILRWPEMWLLPTCLLAFSQAAVSSHTSLCLSAVDHRVLCPHKVHELGPQGLLNWAELVPVLLCSRQQGAGSQGEREVKSPYPQRQCHSSHQYRGIPHSSYASQLVIHNNSGQKGRYCQRQTLSQVTSESPLSGLAAGYRAPSCSPAWEGTVSFCELSFLPASCCCWSHGSLRLASLWGAPAGSLCP